jgi:DNA-binding transcriptional LysR family regulator
VTGTTPTRQPATRRRPRPEHPCRELTRGHADLAAAARALYGGRDGALRQMIAKIETAAGFRIIDRSATPLSPTDAGRGFIREAHQILQAARKQATVRPNPEEGHEEAEVRSC